MHKFSLRRGILALASLVLAAGAFAAPASAAIICDQPMLYTFSEVDNTGPTYVEFDNISNVGSNGGIACQYTSLRIVGYGRDTANVNNVNVKLNLGQGSTIDTTAGHYSWTYLWNTFASGGITQAYSNSSTYLYAGGFPGTLYSTAATGTFDCHIPNAFAQWTSTPYYAKQVRCTNVLGWENTSSEFATRWEDTVGSWLANTNNVTALRLTAESGAFAQHTLFDLYLE